MTAANPVFMCLLRPYSVQGCEGAVGSILGSRNGQAIRIGRFLGLKEGSFGRSSTSTTAAGLVAVAHSRIVPSVQPRDQSRDSWTNRTPEPEPCFFVTKRCQ